ncbi:MAG: hypothetical protein A2W01_06260 [Candidatus Solincola sediminis]|uniref:Serine aminopeptidase S33 domain-containing protein n=1 Tax=Candidatus Solincola sediminis TaxID=1797199 RepID=A0A1F2WSC8_9ACTN|nr:MAG: hypothetical protein A2W01_06260 [Candidatus Solincola sediminis]OFW59781.1 MAG: hypothetical protein A2Y75_07880 [Candidatus Solincola sediminis]
MGKKTLAATISLVIILLFFGSMPAMAKNTAGGDRYTAIAADGVALAMKRYRPEGTARFRKGAQPVVLLPGLMSSLNEFDVRTPEGENYDVELPDPLAAWARGDKYIKRDPMRYYSLAHYLWLQGYDVWLANYRGEGREPYLSGGQTGYTLDDLGIYDAPAIVEKVYEVTKKHPIWFGHSTGSTMAYIYLQGARYGDNGKVISDPALVDERNGGHGKQSIKAFIDLDGPFTCFSGGSMLDNVLSWGSLYWSVFFDIRPFMFQFAEGLVEPLTAMGDWVYQTLQALGIPDLGPLNILFSINSNNLDPAVNKYGAKYCFDGASLRTLAQYADAAAHGVLREDYLNGCPDMFPHDPCEGDGYYYYSASENLKKIKIPALVLADSRSDITNPEDIKKFYDGKTRADADRFIKIPDAAHVDSICGLNAPTFTYPEIGKWLKKVMGRR